MAKKRIPTWLKLVLLAPGLLVLFIVGLWGYMSLTATPIHPDPQAVPSATQSAPLPKWTNAVEQGRQILRAAVTEQNLPGLSVAVGVGGDIVWAEALGLADLETRVPVTPDMRFRIGNGSMVLTSVAAGLLLEKGRLKLDDEIQTYVPDYPKKQSPVTLRQLMGHTAGVRTDSGDEGPFGEHCQRPVEGLKLFKDLPLLFEPGSSYRFSSFGWELRYLERLPAAQRWEMARAASQQADVWDLAEDSEDLEPPDPARLLEALDAVEVRAGQADSWTNDWIHERLEPLSRDQAAALQAALIQEASSLAGTDRPWRHTHEAHAHGRRHRGRPDHEPRPWRHDRPGAGGSSGRIVPGGPSRNSGDLHGHQAQAGAGPHA